MDQVGNCHTLGSVQHIDVANSDTSGRPGRPALGTDGPAQDHQLLLLDACEVVDVKGGIFAGHPAGMPAIGYLFPGQGSGEGTGGSALAARFETVRDLYRKVVIDAFHSQAMAPAATGLCAYLAGLRFRPPQRRVLSTVTGDVLEPGTDLRQLLVRQLCEPVRFSQALDRMVAEVSLLIEVGPGRVLSGLAARSCPDVPVVPLATDGASVTGVLCAAAAAYVLGAPVRHDPLFTATPTYHGDV